MGIINWIFGKHPPRPPDPERSISAALVPLWQSELLRDELGVAGIKVVVSEDHASYLTTGSSEAMANLFVMEPDYAEARRIVEQAALREAPDHALRPIAASDEPFLREMLYAALFVPAGGEPFEERVVFGPPISRYVDGFGESDGDLGWVAETPDGESLGAVWVRRFPPDRPGYGFVDADTPELTIAVRDGARGDGVGTALLVAILGSVPRISLSVDDRNPAVTLYERFGFEILTRDAHTLTMLSN